MIAWFNTPKWLAVANYNKYVITLANQSFTLAHWGDLSHSYHQLHTGGGGGG